MSHQSGAEFCILVSNSSAAKVPRLTCTLSSGRSEFVLDILTANGGSRGRGDTQGVIPAALKFDLCPFAGGDGSDAIGVCDEGVPGAAASIEDCLVGVEDPIAQVISAQELPDVFDGVEFGGNRAAGRAG